MHELFSENGLRPPYHGSSAKPISYENCVTTDPFRYGDDSWTCQGAHPDTASDFRKPDASIKLGSRIRDARRKAKHHLSPSLPPIPLAEGEWSALVVHALRVFSTSSPSPRPSPHPMGRGGSDWTILVVCQRVVGDTANSGSEIGGSVRMRRLPGRDGHRSPTSRTKREIILRAIKALTR